MPEGKAHAAKEAPRTEQGEMSEAEIDNNLKGTFPASDPPSWTLGTDHAEASRAEQDEPESAAE